VKRVPSFVVGVGYAVYRGPTGDGHLHRHAAFQIAIGSNGQLTIEDEHGARHRGMTLVVSPMVRHRLLASDEVTTYLVEPHSRFADHLRQSFPAGIAPAPQLGGLREADISPETSAALDVRLIEALQILQTDELALPDIAGRVGLSPPRLRALAHAQIGMPLARWRVWTRLRRAAQAVQAGMSLADAATEAGFADQAHLTRQMREMMGLTPSSVLPLLRGQLPRDVDRN
jgi:AraC-like DNA-binding protein